MDDQISLWPNDKNPTYLIACNEEGTTQPGLVRIQLVDRQCQHDRHRYDELRPDPTHAVGHDPVR